MNIVSVTEKIYSQSKIQKNRIILEEIFEALLRLHSSRWAIRGLPGVLSDDAIQKFHKEAAYGLLYVLAPMVSISCIYLYLVSYADF